MMKHPFFVLSICLLATAPPLAARDTLTVAAAAGIQANFPELKQAFEQESGIEIEPVFTSSGKIAAQVEQGAPFDVFVSADVSYPEHLYKSGLAVTPPRVYVYGALVAWTLGDVAFDRGLTAVLKAPGIRKIALANPKGAPYGRAAMEALRHYRLLPALQEKIVYGETVPQVNQFVLSQAAEIGLTAKSTVLTAALKDRGHWMEIPEEAYRPIAQAAVILKHGEEHRPAAAKRFFDFLFSRTARDIFARQGYRLP
jgi:molybdate transport system substrate-binding protein